MIREKIQAQKQWGGGDGRRECRPPEIARV